MITVIQFFLSTGLQSFRFGPEIAYVACCVLDVLKGIRNKTLVGGAKKGIRFFFLMYKAQCMFRVP